MNEETIMQSLAQQVMFISKNVKHEGLAIAQIIEEIRKHLDEIKKLNEAQK